MKVFIGGSRRLSRLNRKVTQTLDRLVERDLTIIIGDANGADKAVQSYLANKKYRNVIVFCMQNQCRNNLGDWQSRRIETGLRNNGFEFYAVKDLAMAKETDYGFMLWDSKSKGTLNNIVTLLRESKPVIIYFSPTKTLHKLTNLGELSKILEKCDKESIRKFEKALGLSNLILQSMLWPSDTHSDNHPVRSLRNW
jgi:hypothetical protein